MSSSSPFEPSVEGKVSNGESVETVNSENRPSPPVSLSHQNGEEKIDDVQENALSRNDGHGRQRRELIKRKEQARCEEADNRAAPAATIDSGCGSKKREQRKRKLDGQGEKGDANSRSKAEQASLKMKIKRKKMATRQSAARHVVLVEKESMNSEESHPSLTPYHKSPDPERESFVVDEQRSANKEMKRKLSSSPFTDIGGGLASGKPASCSFSCQQPRRRRSLGVLLESKLLTSSSAPASPANDAGAIKSRRSSPAIIPSLSVATSEVNINTVGRSSSVSPIDRSSQPVELSKGKTETNVSSKMKGDKTKRHSIASCCNDQMPTNKKLKTDRNRKDEGDQKNDETAVASFISATVVAPVPCSATPREKAEQREAGTWVRTVGTTIEQECFGPCEPGTSVTLEGIVWNETKGGILVLNVTWRGKTYVGTLLDCTKYDWAPPQLCDSPGYNESDHPNGANSNWGNLHAPNGTSAKSKGGSNGNGRGRKGHGRGDKRHQQSVHNSYNTNSYACSFKNGPRSEQDQNDSRNQKPTPVSETVLEPTSPILFQCPYGKCEKKFPAIVGLKYHQTSNHRHVCAVAEKHKPCNNCPGPVRGETNLEPLKSACAPTSGNAHSIRPEKTNVELKAVMKAADQQKTSGSPVYSDISEDDGAVGQLVNETTTTALPQHAPAATEKPMAIVEPQCATSSTVPAKPQLSLAEIRAAPTVRSPQLVHPSNQTKQLSAKCGLPADDASCPPLLPPLEKTDRFGNTASLTKLEPSSPCSTSGDPRFATPVAPSMSSTSIRTPRSPMANTQPVRLPRVASPQTMNIMHQLNHPGFIFNPFNPSSAAMLTTASAALQSPGLGLNASTAAVASLFAAAHPPSSVYGHSEAALAAAGFPLGLPNSQPLAHHRSLGLLAGNPMASLAPLLCSSPNTSPQLARAILAHPMTPDMPVSSNRVQQSHKIHELSDHVKRVSSRAQETSVIVDALRRRQMADMSHSPCGASTLVPRRQHFVPNDKSPTMDAGRCQSRPAGGNPTCVSSMSSSSSAPTPVIASTIGYNSQQSDEKFNAEDRSFRGESARRQSAIRSNLGHLSNERLLSASPPVQRHVHTHHHTHTTYPALMTSPIDPYEAMVASQQAAAAAASVVNGYSTFGPSSKA